MKKKGVAKQLINRSPDVGHFDFFVVYNIIYIYLLFLGAVARCKINRKLLFIGFISISLSIIALFLSIQKFVASSLIKLGSAQLQG